MKQRPRRQQLGPLPGPIHPNDPQAGLHPVQALPARAPQVPGVPEQPDQASSHLRVTAEAEGPLKGGPEVVVVGLETLQPRAGAGLVQARLGLLGHRQVVLGVPLLQVASHRLLLQPLPPVLAGGLQQPVAGLPASSWLQLDQGTGHQAGEHLGSVV